MFNCRCISLVLVLCILVARPAIAVNENTVKGLVNVVSRCFDSLNTKAATRSTAIAQFRLIIESDGGWQTSRDSTLSQEEVLEAARQLTKLGYPLNNAKETFAQTPLMFARKSSEGLDEKHGLLAQKLFEVSGFGKSHPQYQSQMTSLRAILSENLLEIKAFEDTMKSFLGAAHQQYEVEARIQQTLKTGEQAPPPKKASVTMEYTPVLDANLHWLPKETKGARRKLELNAPATLDDILNVIAQTPFGYILVERFLEKVAKGEVKLLRDSPPHNLGPFAEALFSSFGDTYARLSEATENNKLVISVALDKNAGDIILPLVHVMFRSVDPEQRTASANHAQELVLDGLTSLEPKAATIPLRRQSLPSGKETVESVQRIFDPETESDGAESKDEACDRALRILGLTRKPTR